MRRRWRQAADHPGVKALLVLAVLGGGFGLAAHLYRRSPPTPEAIAPQPIGPAARPVPPHPANPAKPVEKASFPLPLPAPPATQAPPSWLRFAVPAPPAGDRPLVAIVIDDLGLDRRRTAAVIALPGPLTLSFMTYAQDLPDQAGTGRRAGDELLLHVPMEPIDRAENPGPHALLVAMSADEILAQLRWGLDRFTGFVGVNNHMGSKFTADARGMAVVMTELHQRGLMFLDSKTTAISAGMREAAANGVPHAARDVFLDDDLSRAVIDRQLARVESVARQNGSAIAIGHGHDPTIAALRNWLPSLRKKGFALVPLSAVVRHRMTER
jgi:polysaccharide deacetylase 2 family uncharacterized protein YibQ